MRAWFQLFLLSRHVSNKTSSTNWRVLHLKNYLHSSWRTFLPGSVLQVGNHKTILHYSEWILLKIFDLFCRPWHFVEYFRYIRFFPDGTVHFLTSSDEPTMAIPGLRENIARNQNTLTGTYEMYGSNIISAVVTSQSQPKIGFNNNKMKRNETQTQQSTSFHIELQVCSVKGRHNWMLKWVHHAVFIKKTTITNGKNARQQNAPTATITSTSLELSPTKYPPLLFSRVKSFTPKSECILEWFFYSSILSVLLNLIIIDTKPKNSLF